MAMGKRRVLAVADVIVLVFLSSIMLQGQSNLCVLANGFAPPLYVTLISPSPMQTINSSVVPITVRVDGFGEAPAPQVEVVAWLNYTLDGLKPVSMSFDYENFVYPDGKVSTYLFYGMSKNDSLNNLSDGKHSLKIKGETIWKRPLNLTTWFVVDAQPPSISYLSVENKTYNENSIPLTFSVSESSSMWYELDGQINAINGNTSLLGLSDGLHALEIFANDSIGNIGHSDLVQFEIDTSTPAPNLSPPSKQTGFLGTNIPTEYGYSIIAVLVIVAVAGLSLAYYKKLRK